MTTSKPSAKAVVASLAVGAVVIGVAFALSHRSSPSRQKVAVRASVEQSTTIPSWMTACLTNQHLAGGPVASSDVSTMVTSATAVSAATADHPGFSTAGLITVPVRVGSEADASGSAQIPAIDALNGKALWAVAFTGLQIPYGDQYVQGLTTQPTPYMTSWVELVDGTSGTVVLGVGCN
jgi:hypothetical protein